MSTLFTIFATAFVPQQMVSERSSDGTKWNPGFICTHYMDITAAIPGLRPSASIRATLAYDPAISGPPKPVEAAGAQVPRRD